MIEIAADLRFGLDDAGPQYLDVNWANPEDDFTWSTGVESRVMIPVRPGGGELVLELDAEPFVLPPALLAQRLAVSLDGQMLFDVSLTGRATLRIPLAAEQSAGATSLVFQLHHPDAARPVDLGLNTDRRQLGIRLRRAVMLRVPAEAAPARAEGAHEVELTLTFGWDGNGATYLRGGWEGPEDRCRWAVGRHSEIVLPLAQPGADYAMLAEMHPALVPGARQQRYVIGANGGLVSYLALRHHAAVAVALPRAATQGREVVVGFDNLDAATEPHVGPDARPLAFALGRLRLVRLAPDDARPEAAVLPPVAGNMRDGSLGAAAEALTGVPLGSMLGGFTALCDGCELAEAQAGVGLDRIGLLRFVSIDTARLVEGLITRFRDLGRPDTIELYEKPGDANIHVRETNYHMEFRTPYPAGEWRAQSPRVVRAVGRRLAFLRRQFLEELDGGETIYVLRSLLPLARPEAEAVATALGLHGRRTLLWLTQDGTLPPGAVLRLGPNLLQGALDVTGEYATASQEAWISTLANAWVLTRE